MGLSQSAQIRLNMARIASDTGVSEPKQEELDANDEEAAPNQTSEEETICDEEQHRCGWWAALSKGSEWFFLSFFSLVILIIIVVSVVSGLTRGRGGDITLPDNFFQSENNLDIFDEALAILESTPLQKTDIPSGETLSYREYNKEQPQTLIMLPGYMTDDTLASILSVLPEFHDHHIIAVNPPGWHGSTMNTPAVESHATNADVIVELMEVVGVAGQAMVMGFSTGGGIAFHMAARHPNKIKAAFLTHSIPLDGLR